VAVVALAASAASCATWEFYRQAVAGQMSILQHRQSSEVLIVAPDTSPHLRQRLVKVAELVRFAREHLALEPGKRYSSYVRVDGEYVVWNVFAAQEFSTAPIEWCYPIAGCATYRGYFKADAAHRYAQGLIAGRKDTAVDGVAAYSTLGWFEDPVLSTFIDWSDPALAGLIFHELAHARVFVGGDTAFNESFASFVERRGQIDWLRSLGDDAGVARATARWRTSDRFVAFLLAWREELSRLYAQPFNADALRLLKSEVFAEVERCYRANQNLFGNQDWFFGDELNNARLVPLAAYHEYIAGFEQLFVQSDESWPAFYVRAAETARLDAGARAAELQRLGREGSHADAEVNPGSVRCDTLRY
ncbi:MAG TPA: aminopeptidase, partial [Pseudomonadales bacterium]